MIERTDKPGVVATAISLRVPGTIEILVMTKG
jgi:hypothetical protein